MFRICSEFSVMFRICSEFSAMFRICSEFSVKFRICSEFSAIFRIFRMCSDFSAMFRICSEFSAMFRIFSNVQNLFRKTGLFRISWLCSVWVTQWVSHKKRELLTLHEHLSSSRFFGEVRFAHLFCFLLLSYYVSLHSEFRVVMSVTISVKKMMFCSSLPPVVCRRAHVFFTLFVLCVSFSGLSIFDCPFGIL